MQFAILTVVQMAFLQQFHLLDTLCITRIEGNRIINGVLITGESSLSLGFVWLNSVLGLCQCQGVGLFRFHQEPTNADSSEAVADWNIG